MLALTCDTDTDLFDPSVQTDSRESCPHWEGVARGIPLMIKAVNRAAARYQYHPRFTWFVRVDQQVGHYYGQQSYLLDTFVTLWDSCRENGDEIAWHPHIYHLDGNGEWVAEQDDERFCASLRDSHTKFVEVSGRATASRIGEARFSNRTAETLDELGVLCDSSAMPGRWRHDDARVFDWRNTPSHPYHPSVADYRVPGSKRRCLLEVPMTMVPIKAEYDAQPYMRYVDLSFRHELLRDGLAAVLAAGDLLVSMTHPSGVLSDIVKQRHGLIGFSIENYRRNVDFIFHEAARLDRTIQFTTISEIYDAHKDGKAYGAD